MENSLNKWLNSKTKQKKKQKNKNMIAISINSHNNRLMTLIPYINKTFLHQQSQKKQKKKNQLNKNSLYSLYSFSNISTHYNLHTISCIISKTIIPFTNHSPYFLLNFIVCQNQHKCILQKKKKR